MRDVMIEAHYRATAPRLVKVLSRRRDPADAADIVQEAYARALKYYDSFNPEIAGFNTWFGMILKNARKDHDMSRTDPVDNSGVELGKVGAIDVLRIVYIKELLAEAQTMRDIHRQAIYMALCLGYSHGEIAELLSMSEKNIGVVVHRFREKVR